MEAGFQRHLTSYELLTVRTVVVDNLLVVDEQARTVVGSYVEVVDALLGYLYERTEVVAEVVLASSLGEMKLFSTPSFTFLPLLKMSAVFLNLPS